MISPIRDKRTWTDKVPAGRPGSKGIVRNPFEEAIEAARKTASAAHGFEKPTPNHPNPHTKNRIRTWGEVYSRHAPTKDRNEIEDHRRTWQAPKRNKAKDV